ncbi:MAG: phenylalanine--tRNA ligase beta subunit-related protein [Sporolactobacillus sp.]
MVAVCISPELREVIPDFQIGVIVYHRVTIAGTPAIIANKLPLYYQNIKLSLAEQPVATIPGVAEWRRIFKAVGTDPSRYRPSQEALLRKIARDGAPHHVNSAVDLNNFFSVQHGIPMGIYNLGTLEPPIQLIIGSEQDTYDALNGRQMSMANKIVAVDQQGAFGSPIVDSRRSALTESAEDALQMVYLRPSMKEADASRMLEKMAEMFVQVHGGDSSWTIVH